MSDWSRRGPVFPELDIALSLLLQGVRLSPRLSVATATQILADSLGAANDARVAEEALVLAGGFPAPFPVCRERLTHIGGGLWGCVIRFRRAIAGVDSDVAVASVGPVIPDVVVSGMVTFAPGICVDCAVLLYSVDR